MAPSLAVYHQCFKNKRATAFALNAFLKHNPGVPYFLWSDGGYDFSDIALGYPEVCYRYSSINSGKNHYTPEKVFEVFSRIRSVAVATCADLILNMEDDVLTRGALCVPQYITCSSIYAPGNKFPASCLQLLRDKYDIEPFQDWYGMAGGSLINGALFRDKWQLVEEFLLSDYRSLFAVSGESVSHEDILISLLHMIAGLRPKAGFGVRQYIHRKPLSLLRVYDFARYRQAPLLHNFKQYY